MAEKYSVRLEEYEKARKSAQRQYRASIVAGTYPYLPALDDLLPYVDIVSENDLGIVEIPLEMVVGTKTAGRQSAFASNFMPLLAPHTEFGGKWMSLYSAQMEEGIRDPILAFEFLNKFYVQEGNKRVSVLKYVGAASIVARVTRLVPKRSDSKENKIYYEFMDFYRIAQINEIWFSKEGSFAKFMELTGFGEDDPWTSDQRLEVKSDYARFRQAFEDKGGKRLSATAGDAMLVYLEIFGLEHLESASDGALRDEIGKIWEEIQLAGAEKTVALVEEPEKNKDKAANLLDFLIPTPAPKRKIAFISTKTPETSNWTYSHELGRLYVEQVFKDQVTTTHIDNINTSAETTAAIEMAIAAGNTVIFTTAAQMVTAALKEAVLHPEIKILNCSVNTSYKSVRTYYGRMYEAKFLIGAIAATQSEQDDLGYLADYPIYGMVANINAFALGARMINPRAKVHLEWSTIKGHDPLAAFSDKGICLVSGKDSITPIEENRQFGLFRKNGNEIENLASPIWHWGKYYEKIIRQILSGSWDSGLAKKEQALNYWWGMSAEVIDVVYANRTPEGTKHLLTLLKKAICRGEFHPFEGVLKDQEGIVRCADGQVLQPEQIVTMDWLAENVVGRIPLTEELTDEAKEVVHIHGTRKDGD